jgi:hypothetical protein
VPLFSIGLDTPVVGLRIGDRNEARYESGFGLISGEIRDEEYFEIGGVIKGCTITGQLFSFCEITSMV